MSSGLKLRKTYYLYSQAVNITDVEIAFLPNLAGGEHVRSLHEAMQLSAEQKP
ncbi:hypothetical protein [Moraxella sp. ZY210820]|uniref:hypothetical protein n=1 Tax=unclassified Moraxella TaxID=2685852 RepID=UPI0027302EF8|nr:hypothetical protein [Moraxella sp. ZY210820]WLF84281.1 hypothetical protein LU301_01940 [Moraxella sp. ZY210820]